MLYDVCRITITGTNYAFRLFPLNRVLSEYTFQPVFFLMTQTEAL